MSRKSNVRPFGPLRGEELERHVDQKLVIGEIINFSTPEAKCNGAIAGVRFWSYSDDFSEVMEVHLAYGRVLLLGNQVVGGSLVWKIHHLDKQQQYFIADKRLRGFLKLKVQDSWYNRYNKGKIAHLTRKQDRR